MPAPRCIRSVAIALSLLASLPAIGQEPCAPVAELGLTAIDNERLGQLAASRTRGLAQARAGGDPAALKLLEDLFGAEPEALATIPAGSYRCRTIKLGGDFGDFVAYDFFSCRVSAAGGVIRLEKLSGSQRFAGELLPIGGGLVFRGADHYADEEPLGYGDDPERNAVGCLSRVAGNGGPYLLEFPMPFLESLHDVIELRQ